MELESLCVSCGVRMIFKLGKKLCDNCATVKIKCLTEKRYCSYEHCPNPKRAMPPVGVARLGGGNGSNDYAERPMHKMCSKKCMHKMCSKKCRGFIGS